MIDKKDDQYSGTRQRQEAAGEATARAGSQHGPKLLR